MTNPIRMEFSPRSKLALKLLEEWLVAQRAEDPDWGRRWLLSSSELVDRDTLQPVNPFTLDLVDEGCEQVLRARKAKGQYRRGLLTEDELYQELIEIWTANL